MEDKGVKCDLCRQHSGIMTRMDRAEARQKERDDDMRIIADEIKNRVPSKLFYVFLTVITLVLMSMGGLTLNSTGAVNKTITDLRISMVEQFGEVRVTLTDVKGKIALNQTKLNMIDTQLKKEMKDLHQYE